MCTTKGEDCVFALKNNAISRDKGQQKKRAEAAVFVLDSFNAGGHTLSP
jgi:hypothetical protein